MSELGPLEGCTGLQRLDVSSNNIRSLGPLAGLRSLTGGRAARKGSGDQEVAMGGMGEEKGLDCM